MKYLIILCMLLYLGCANQTETIYKDKPECPNTFGTHFKLPIKISISDKFSREEAMQISIGFSEWNDKLGVRVFELADYGAKIYPAPHKNFDYRQLAVTKVYFFGGELLSEVAYNMKHVKQTNVDLAILTMHEAGHLLGLKHKENTIMHPKYSTPIDIDAESIQSVRCLYGI